MMKILVSVCAAVVLSPGSSRPLFAQSAQGAPAAQGQGDERLQSAQDTLLFVNTNPDDHWNSTSMEATSMLGEVEYHFSDYKDAKDKFRGSLNTSTKLRNPRAEVMAMDLYRSAELEFKDDDDQTAKRHLDILISRYPDTTWAEKGRHLLKRLPETPQSESYGETLTAVSDQGSPGSLLRQIQVSLKSRQWKEALSYSAEFRERYPQHPMTEEVQLLSGLLLLHQHEPAKAAQRLESVAAQSANPGIQAKARYALGAAYAELGDDDGVRAAIPAVKGDGAASPWLAQAQLWRADSDFKHSHWESAAGGYRAVLKSPQDSPAKAFALATLAAEWSREGNAELAAKTMQEARTAADRWRLDELLAYTELSMGHLYYRERNYAGAAKAYDAFLKDHPEDPQAALAAYQRGMALKWTGHTDQALGVFKDITQRYPKSEWTAAAYLQLGQLYNKEGMSQEAISSYQQMGKQADAEGGQDKESLLLVAQVHYNRKEFREAIPEYLKFLEQAPDDPRAQEVQGLLINSYWQGAKDDPGLRQALDQYPRHPVVAQIRWDLAVQGYKEKDFTTAEQQFKRLTQDFPDSSNTPAGLFYRAESLMQLQNYMEAASAYRQLLGRFPNSPYSARSQFKMGIALYEAGDYRGSAQAYARYKPRDKNDPPIADALFNNALALQKAGLKDYAADAYERMLLKYPRYPKSSWAWFQVALLREQTGQSKAAIGAYARVSGEERPEALWNAGRDCEKLKDRASAAKFYEELRRVRPTDDVFRLRGLARLALLYELRSPQKAEPLYRELQRISPDPANREFAAKHLEAIQALKAERQSLRSLK